MAKIPDTATGTLARHIPAGPQRDELLGLVRLGIRFKSQHVGRRTGFLFNYLVLLSQKIKPLTFARLLDELAFEARRRELLGAKLSPIEKLNREWELLTYHDPKHGRLQIPFDTLRNKLTQVKKTLSQFPL